MTPATIFDVRGKARSAGTREEASLAHTPVTILTGFLGSGKTTLFNRALRDPAMANTAVVINEFGEVGLDHLLAARSDDTIMVLENGCLCCTVFGDLVTTLNNLYHAREDGEIPRFDHVVIETSGLADPSPLIQAFLSDPTLAGLYRLGTVVATVDAVNGPATLDKHIESVRQAALADRILITKLDLLGAAEAKVAEAALTARLRRLNPAAKISRFGDPALDIGGLLRAAGLDPGGAVADARAWLNAAAYEQRDGGQHPAGEGHEHCDDHAHPARHAGMPGGGSRWTGLDNVGQPSPPGTSRSRSWLNPVMSTSREVSVGSATMASRSSSRPSRA